VAGSVTGVAVGFGFAGEHGHGPPVFDNFEMSARDAGGVDCEKHIRSGCGFQHVAIVAAFEENSSSLSVVPSMSMKT
jgi:hypothetical protein